MKLLFKETLTKEAVTTLEDYSYKSHEINHFETRPNLHIFRFKCNYLNISGQKLPVYFKKEMKFLGFNAIISKLEETFKKMKEHVRLT